MPKTAISKRHKLSLNRERKLAGKLNEIRRIVKQQCDTCGLGTVKESNCENCSIDRIGMVASSN